MKVKIGILIGIAVLGLIAVFFTCGRHPKYNVIMIVIDALRADHLGCYGYYRGTSPGIDKFSRQSLVFSRAFSQGTETRISVPSLLTSLYPSVHKVYTLRNRLPDEFVTLPEILKKNGYITAAFVPQNIINNLNFRQGFDLYKVSLEHEEGDMLVREIFEWLDTNCRKPFFIYLHYFGAHAPYRPSPPYDRLFWEGGVLPEERIRDLDEHTIVGSDIFGLGLAPADQKTAGYLISQYDGKIRQADEQIKELLEELENSGAAKNTLIIITADHGEELLDHGNIFHSSAGLLRPSEGVSRERSVYDELIHIPLIMRLPGMMQNKRIPQLVRHIDIMPTILDILNIRYSGIMQGQSLMPLIKGRAAGLRLDSFSEGYYDRHAVGFRNREWKFVEHRGRGSKSGELSYELYDLKNDPKELNNVLEKYPEPAALLKGKLANYAFSCEKIRNAVLGEGFIDKPADLDEQTKEKLRNFGYIE